mmetsp:Transcript_14712/g.19298  ORF Transcript_14712/g.19298 Transcript_14712/m.19298 type:complete len:418 (+) Transcript_14712:279-1532(+)
MGNVHAANGKPVMLRKKVWSGKWHYAPPKALDRYYRPPESANSEEICRYLNRQNSGFDYFESDDYIELRDLLDEDDQGRQMFVNFAGEEGPSTYVLVTAWILMHDYHTIEEPSERFKALSKIKSDVLDPVVTAMEEDSDVATENAASAVPKNVKVWIRNNIKVIEKEISSFQENIPVGEGECTQVKLGKSPRADIFIPLQSIVFRDLVAVMHSFKKTASYTEFCKLKKLSYNKILPDDFKYMEVLGKGGFGKVVHVMKRSTGQHYAMKIQAKDRLLETWGDALYNLEIERDVLVAHNSFAFIVSLRYAFQDKKYAFLALDLIQGGSLRQLIESAAGYQLEKAQVRLYVAEIVLALECLHEHEIIYRDLKPENVLLTANGHIRLADMGLAGFFYQSKYYDEDDSQRRKEIPKKASRFP